MYDKNEKNDMKWRAVTLQLFSDIYFIIVYKSNIYNTNIYNIFKIDNLLYHLLKLRLSLAQKRNEYNVYPQN